MYVPTPVYVPTPSYDSTQYYYDASCYCNEARYDDCSYSPCSNMLTDGMYTDTTTTYTDTTTTTTDSNTFGIGGFSISIGRKLRSQQGEFG